MENVYFKSLFGRPCVFGKENVLKRCKEQAKLLGIRPDLHDYALEIINNRVVGFQFNKADFR